jgi:hypothetical protein
LGKYRRDYYLAVTGVCYQALQFENGFRCFGEQFVHLPVPCNHRFSHAVYHDKSLNNKNWIKVYRKKPRRARMADEHGEYE